MTIKGTHIEPIETPSDLTLTESDTESSSTYHEVIFVHVFILTYSTFLLKVPFF